MKRKGFCKDTHTPGRLTYHHRPEASRKCPRPLPFPLKQVSASICFTRMLKDNVSSTKNRPKIQRCNKKAFLMEQNQNFRQKSRNFKTKLLQEYKTFDLYKTTSEQNGQNTPVLLGLPATREVKSCSDFTCDGPSLKTAAPARLQDGSLPRCWVSLRAWLWRTCTAHTCPTPAVTETHSPWGPSPRDGPGGQLHARHRSGLCKSEPVRSSPQREALRASTGGYEPQAQG